MHRTCLLFACLLILSLSVPAFSQPQWTQHTVAFVDGIRAMRAVDVDNDGDTDLITGNQGYEGSDWWEVSLGDITRHTLTSDYDCHDVEVADFDQDGITDLTTASRLDNGVRIYRTTGSGLDLQFQVSGVAYYVKAVDFDQDGDTDLLAIFQYPNAIKWIENLGTDFTVHTLLPNLPDFVIRLDAGDVDNDGDLDLVYSQYATDDGKIMIARNPGAGQPWTAFPIAVNYDGAYDVQFHDFNGDGWLDILATSERHHTIDWFENTQTGVIRHTVGYCWQPHEVAVADVDGDNQLDIVCAKYTTGISWWSDDGGDLWTEHEIAPMLGASYVVAEDFDQDGDIDIATASHFQGRLMWVEQNGSPSAPLEIELIPHNTPIHIPAGGGVVICDVHMSNTSDQSYSGIFRTMLELPNGASYGPLSSIGVALAPHSGLSFISLGTPIPGGLPPGDYQFIGEIVTSDFTVSDSFPFHKAGNETELLWSYLDVPENPEVPAENDLPTRFALCDPSPNPFNPSTTISVSLPETADLTVMVYNMTGQQVAELHRGPAAAGTHEFVLDGSTMASGVYFVRATVPGQLDDIRKVVLLK